MKIKDKSVVITGASRGLGRALSAELASRGAKVAMIAREAGPLHQAAAEIREAGGAAFPLPGDVGDKDAVHALAGAAAALAGPVDIVIHNASTLGPLPMPLLLDIACEDLARVLEVNLIGPFRLSKALAGAMALRGRGLLVHISSDAAASAYPGWGAYGVSKAALDHLSRSWDAELAGTGVRSIAIDPGEMDTRMHADALPDADRGQLADPAAVARRIADLIEAAQGLPQGARVLAQEAAS